VYYSLYGIGLCCVTLALVVRHALVCTLYTRFKWICLYHPLVLACGLAASCAGCG
jgi:hypothetical protein